MKRDEAEKQRKRRGQPIVRAVLDATMEELARVGFANLSIEDVAAQAGVNKTTVYRRFGTKEQLVFEALGHTVERVTDIPDTGSVRTDFVALLRQVATFLCSTRGKAVLRVMVAESNNPELACLIDAMLPHEEIVIPRVVVKRAVERGELSPGTDAKLLLFTMVGALLHRILLENASVTEAYIEKIVDLVLFGAANSYRQ